MHVQDSEHARVHVHTYVCVHACAQDATSPRCSCGNERMRAPTARMRVCACTCTHVCTAGAYACGARVHSEAGLRAGPMPAPLEKDRAQAMWPGLVVLWEDHLEHVGSDCTPCGGGAALGKMGRTA